MKILIASDIHGSAEFCRQLLEAYTGKLGLQLNCKITANDSNGVAR